MAISDTSWRWVRIGGVFIALTIGALGWLGRKSQLGTRLQISELEAINYSGDATEQDAKSLGAALQKVDFFAGQRDSDVLLNKGVEGVVVSFVVQDGKWNDPEIVSGFETIGRQIASSVGGPPYAIRLIDDELKTHKSLTIDTSETKFQHSDQESVRYFGDVTEVDASKLGQALEAAGYFDNTAPAEVLLKRTAAGFAVSFVVQEGSWDNAQIAAQMEEYGRQIVPAMGGGVLTVNMVDPDYETRWTTTVNHPETPPTGDSAS